MKSKRNPRITKYPPSASPKIHNPEQIMPIKSTIHKRFRTYREHVKINALKSAVIAIALGVKK
jgi:hypothetical protein